MAQDIKDITIIGAGPTGLFALFYAGMRRVTAQIVDALPEAGGQLTFGNDREIVARKSR